MADVVNIGDKRDAALAISNLQSRAKLAQEPTGEVPTWLANCPLVLDTTPDDG